jgi:CubicO group peptidase (beta-lactamase class C family)
MNLGLNSRLAILSCSLLLLLSPPAPGQSGPDSTARRDRREKNLKAFLEEEIEFDRYLLPPGKFPSVHWKRPAAVADAVGDVPLTAEFYDRSFTSVAKAESTGRYGAVVHGATRDGYSVVRYATLYCSDASFDDYAPDVPLTMNPLPGSGIGKSQWQLYQQNLRRFSFGSFMLSPEHDPDAAILLAGLSGLDPLNAPRDTPRLRDRQWWVDFKRLHDGRNHPPVTLPVPRTSAPSRVVTDLKGKLTEPFNAEHLRNLRALCTAWSDSTGEPLVGLVVYKGHIVFHETFGKKADGSPMTRSTPTWMASITKLITGVVVMQFVDRGVLDLDAPLDRYLPEFSSPSPLTLRSLLTHTSGLSWAGEWASDWNPSYENQAAQAVPLLMPGRAFKYHRAGYALAGKVLERLTGLTAPALMDRLLLTPLGMKSAFVDNTYGGLYCTAFDLAVFGQMLLNHGRYGNLEYLSGESWEEFLPRPLRYGGAELNKSWGIGSAPLGGDGFSPSTFGHEAASGALFRIDPEHELVVVVGCNRVGQQYRLYERCVSRFLRGVTAPWESNGPHG